MANAQTLCALPNLTDDVRCCDLIEYRLDSLWACADFSSPLPIHGEKPIIVTARDPIEGGQNSLKLSERRHLFEQHQMSASILDIEIRNLSQLAEIRDAAQIQGRLVLGSFHDFNTTPPESELEDTIKRGIDARADGIKLAVTTNTPQHIRTLLHLLERYQSEIPMAVMGMGTLGMSSRILLAQCGSILNYGYLSEANAPGQWSAAMMRRLFNEIGIGRNA